MLSSLPRVNESRYDTTVSMAAACNYKIEKQGSRDPPLRAGLKPGRCNGQNKRQRNDAIRLRGRELNARGAPTRYRTAARCSGILLDAGRGKSGKRLSGNAALMTLVGRGGG